MSERLKIIAMRHGLGLSMQEVSDMESMDFTRSKISKMEQNHQRVDIEYVKKLNDVCVQRSLLLSAVKLDLELSTIKQALPYCATLGIFTRATGSKSVQKWRLWQSVLSELLIKGAPICVNDSADLPSGFLSVKRVFAEGLKC